MAERQRANEGIQRQPTDKTRCVNTVYHFSEDASIERFEPHIPRSNPTQPPAVWAIDDAAIELRAVPSLWELHDAVQSDGWDFSIVRMRNAVPRS